MTYLSRRTIAAFSVLITLVIGCTHKSVTNDPVFNWFEYSGNDPIYNQIELADDEFVNPIMPGFYPDPSIVAVGEDFYMVHSTFSYFPGIPIFHSKDLVNWTQIGNVMDRPSQMRLDSLGISRGVFAPTIEYHDGTFYVINTLVDSGGNFIVTAKDPAGPWSEPMFLNGVGGIDPSLFFDDDGKVYILNNDAPEGRPEYVGHRAIWIREYDLDKNEPVGKAKVLINGGVDFSKKPIWIEGPHMMKVDGTYYLHCAEGGTGPDHSQVVLRGNSPMGDFTPFPGNPILTQRHIPVDREFPVEYTGHADLVETVNGDWWAIFLGVRPYDGKNFNTGRETFLLPVSWKNGWPVILEGDAPVPVKVTKPNLPVQDVGPFPTNGNFTLRDEFDGNELEMYWLFMRTPYEKWYQLNDGSLRIKARSGHISSLGQPSFIGRRQQHAFAEFSTQMEYKPQQVGDEAGLVANQNGIHYFFFGLGTNDTGETQLQLKQRVRREETLLETKIFEGSSVELKIEARGAEYDFYYKTPESSAWELFYGKADGTILSTEAAGGFVGTVVGMYAYTDSE